MTKQAQINEDIKTAMKAKNELALRVLRQLKSAVSNAALQSGNMNTPVGDMEVIGIIRKQIKQREDSAAQYVAGNRQELADIENQEKDILVTFLPKGLTDSEVDELIDSSIKELSASTKKDMGKVIKRVVELVAGRADSKLISQKVATKLQ